MNSIVPYHRFKIMTVAVAAVTVLTVLPMAASVYVAYRSAIDVAHERSLLAADQALAHASALLRDVAQALEEVEGATDVPCSEQHIKKMYAAAIAVPDVAEIGYVAEGVLQCTTWAGGAIGTSERQADFSLSNGMAVTRHAASMNIDRGLMRLQRGAHYALIDPASFTDIHVDTGTSIMIESVDGHVLGSTNDSAEELDPKSSRTDHDEAVSAVRRDATLMVLSHAEPERGMLALLRRHPSMLALGGLLSLMMFATSIRLVRKRLSPLAAMEEAIKCREFTVHYQPIIALDSGVCVGAEALVRWRRANGRYVPPDVFIPFAEENGLIFPITDQVIAAVVADVGPTLAARSDLHVAVNICAQDIQSGRILDVLDVALKSSGIRPHQIWLEATERGVRDVDAIHATLVRARQIGYKTAIDDFGTGYSSLSCLEKLPLHVLKIDKSFIDTGANSGRVLNHIVALGKALGLSLVAEGIETPAQAAQLRRQGVDFGQGWLYAKAMPASEFRSFLRKR